MESILKSSQLIVFSHAHVSYYASIEQWLSNSAGRENLEADINKAINSGGVKHLKHLQLCPLDPKLERTNSSNTRLSLHKLKNTYI